MKRPADSLRPAEDHKEVAPVRDKEFVRSLQEYVDDLSEVIRKLRAQVLN